MTHTVDDDYLKLSLHLSNGQFFVKSLFFSSEEDLGDVYIKEDMGETLEPSCMRKNLPIQNFSVYFSFTFHPNRL